MEHIVRGAVLFFCSILPAALTACTFDTAGLQEHDTADAGHDLVDAAPVTEPDGSVVDAATPDAPTIADAAPPPAPDARVCPSNFTVLPATGHAYRERHGHQSWFQAEDTCESTGPGIHLAVIDDATELAAVESFIDVQPIWVGVNDVDIEGHFVTVTGGPATFLPWAPGEPNNNQGAEDCVEILGNAFNDDACDTALPFLCECE